MTHNGSLLGKYQVTRGLVKRLFHYENKKLSQKLAGVVFENPIGLSAGFDYNGLLTQILPSVGFGLETVGTVTNIPYEGNPRPRLARLPESKSLLVNKGFKSVGTDKIINKLGGVKLEFPVGISVGRSNSDTLKTLPESIDDIVSSFKKFEKSGIRNAYYELNISCPNLIHGGENITFYPPENLEMLLKALDKLKIKKPLFIKMPITEDDKSFEAMLDVIVKHKVTGVIIGNLLKDRKNPSFVKAEVKSAPPGNFSGYPCFKRSNELIFKAYQKYGKKLVIIGCGGVFSPYDAYEKIKLGSSLVMMITGMIYEGPQVVGQINRGLVELLARDGYKNISEAVGAYHRL